MASILILSLTILTVFNSLHVSPAFSRWESVARQSGLLGAPSEMSKEALKDKFVQQAAQFAVKQLNIRSSGTAAPYVLVKILSGTSQVSQPCH